MTASNSMVLFLDYWHTKIFGVFTLEHQHKKYYVYCNTQGENRLGVSLSLMLDGLSEESCWRTQSALHQDVAASSHTDKFSA